MEIDQANLSNNSRAHPPSALALWFLTFRGIAAFAQAPIRRLLQVELVMALVGAASIVWFFTVACGPVIEEALHSLPGQMGLRDGTLEWNGDSPILLGHTAFMAMAVDLTGEGQVFPASDIQWVFGRSTLRIISRFGQFTIHYPGHRTVLFNRMEWIRLWQTWHSALLAGIGGAVVLALLIGWALLAGFYSLLLRVVVPKRYDQLGWEGCWRLTSASLMPGALFMSSAVAMYGSHQVNLTGYLTAFVMHFVMGWVCLFFSLRHLTTGSSVLSGT